MLRIILFISFPFLLFGQNTSPIFNLQGKWMTVKDGLSQGYVHCILRDKQGFMWFSTSDGLNRYDGYEMKTFRHDPKDKYSLPDNSVGQMMEDDKGNFWLGTQNKGLFLFDRKKERFYPLAPKYGTFFPEFRNGLLVTHSETDICLYDISRVKPENYENPDIRLLFSYNQLQPLEKYKVKSAESYELIWAKNGVLWISFEDAFFRLIPNATYTQWEICHYPLSIFKNMDYYLLPFPNQENKCLIPSEKGIIVYNIESEKIALELVSFIPCRSSLKGDEIMVYKGNKCFLLNLKTYQLTPLQINGIEEHDYGFLVYEDKNDLTWLGTNGFGLIKCDRRLERFSTYKNTKKKRFNNLMVYDWINGYYEKTFLDTIDLGFNSLISDNAGAFWYYRHKRAGSAENGMFHFKPNGHLTFYPQPIPYGSNNGMIFRDNADNIWIFADEGLQKKMIYRYNKKAQRADTSYCFPNAPHPQTTPFISQAWQDEKGIFWFATLQGLFRFDEAHNQWKQWRHEENNPYSLSSDLLYTLCPDPVSPDKYLWLGTAGQGFSRFEYATGKCIHFTEKDGLTNNVVYGILSDSLNNLWLSTNKGLSCFSYTAFVKGEEAFRNFNEEDGLQGEEFNRYEFLKLPKGKLMFGGVDGFVIFDPMEVLKKSPPLGMAFTGLAIKNEAIDWKTNPIVLSEPIQFAKSITLQPHQNIFTLSFAILEYRGNDKKYYKYKLEGFDKEWTTKSTRNEATYTNLSPGTYTFRVKGRASDGVWNEEGIAIQVVVLPAWYQTKLFYLIVVCLFLGFLYALYHYRLQQMLRTEMLRNRIARDLHDEIGSTLSSIGIYGEAAKKMAKGNPGVEKTLNIINRSVSEMMESMSDIVWATYTQNDNLEELINRMRAFAAKVCESKEIKLHFPENNQLKTIALDMVQRKNMYLIFKEAVNNAMKYADCKNLAVEFSISTKRLKMCIKDDGKGFDMEEEAQHFSGNGLKNMRSRAKELKGMLVISSQKGEGTSICLELLL